jgi:hypothetical protein
MLQFISHENFNVNLSSIFIQYQGKNRRKVDIFLLFLCLNGEGGLSVKLINFTPFGNVGLVSLCN